MDFEMGRWAGLSSLIDFHFESLPGHHFHFTRNRHHRHNLSSDQHSQSSRNGMPAVTLSTKYHKLDDSIFVLCKNCGHSLKTDELRKMAAHAGPAPSNRFRQNPKHFFTWSATAANNRLQKLSKNFVNNVSKLQSKMERALQNQQGLTSQVNNNNIHSQCHNNGGFCDEPLSCPTVTTLTHSPTLHKASRSHCNNENQLTMPSSMKRQSISNSSGSSASLVANMATSEPTTVVIKTARKTHHYNLNNGFQSSSSNSNNNSSESNNNSPTELNSCRKLGEKPPLVKTLGDVDIDVLEMRTVVRKSSSVASKYNLSNNSSCSNNTSLSSNLSSATTLPIVSPQWSRASSISTIGPSTAATITSTSQQQQNCDNSSITKRSNSSSKMNSPNVNVSGGSSNRDGNGKGLQQSNLNSPHQLPNQHELEDSCSNSLNSSASTTTDSSTSPLISATTNNNSSTTNTTPTNNNKSASDCRNNNNSSSNNNHSPNNNNSGLLPTLKNPLATSTPTSKLAITIFEEEAELRHAPWFQAGIPREIALEVLRNEPIGSFIVRESTTKSGCFALSLRVPREFQPTGIAHYLILRTGRGYKIKGFTKEFGSLSSLITHHSVMPELLPCPLSLHRYRPKHAHRVSRINSSDFVEPEKLITFRKFTDF